MTNLSTDLRRRLADELTLFTTDVAEEDRADDDTVKLVLRLADGHTIEAVMIPDRKRRTGCLSTQVGCPVGCQFCASGAAGLARNLSAAEIVEEALHLERVLAEGERLTHLVFMGIGEALLNFDNVARAIETLNAPWGLNIGARRMTVSTVGVRGTIGQLASLGLQVNLAISLHAPDDALRARLIPYGPLMSVRELVEAAADYREATGRDVTFEYVLLAGVNDTAEQAEALAKVAKSCHAAVNLIPYNQVAGGRFKRPARQVVSRFQNTLNHRRVIATVRRSRGSVRASACGQLRLDALKKEADG
jgi:23S rRNA (adenine2503-C2)-methyltransferase